MAASTNATTVMYGTAWTSDTLLAQTIDTLKRQGATDGVRRVFTYAGPQVGAEVPAYDAYLRAEVLRLGREHPLIKTQYYLETIDAQGGLFPPRRQDTMRGSYPRRREPVPGHRHALLIDVGGEDAGRQAGESGPMQRSFLTNPRRDATALTVVDAEVRHGELPIYRTVDRRLWLGTPHAQLHHEILTLARHWHAQWVVVDATGVGAGLASFLSHALPDRVIPVVFSPKVKSDLGWAFVGLVETGRYKDYLPDNAPETDQFWYEVQACEYEVRPGPSQQMRWGVWEPPAYDGWVARGHDDLLVSAALCAVLDKHASPTTGASATVSVGDALEEIDGAEW